MKTMILPHAKTLLLTLAIAAVSPVHAGDFATTGALPIPANRIVGVWTSDGSVTPCNNPAGPVTHVRNTLVFNAGGTALENPGGLPTVAGASRSFSLGTWQYDHATRRHTLFLRFDTYLNGVYTGYQTVDRELTLNSGSTAASGPVVSTRYDTAGNVLAQVCGSAVSARVD